jgi:magnesium-transporting ATPase (P-type)
MLDAARRRVARRPPRATEHVLGDLVLLSAGDVAPADETLLAVEHTCVRAARTR